MIVATIDQRVILPYRQTDDYSTAPYVYASLLSENQMLLYNPTTGKFEVKTLSVIGHSHSFSGLSDKPTDLNGYGILDAYTKNQVDSLLSTVSVDLSNFYTKNQVDFLVWPGNTAYDWGNHALAGYLTSSHDHDSVYLKLTGGTITGTLNGTTGNFTSLSTSTLTLAGRTLTIRTL